MSSNLHKIKKRLKEVDSRVIKSLGQHFLIHLDLIESIVAQVKKDSSFFIEIGPGLGSLTDYFESEKQNMILIEKDKKFIQYWIQKRGFQVIGEDALKLDWSTYPKQSTLFGNLPYSIAGPLILELSHHYKHFFKVIVMMQKEVAERILASSGKPYGILSVVTQAFWNIRPIAIANPEDFHPQPKVFGQILEFKPKEICLVKDPKDFLFFIKTCFTHRRKKLIKQMLFFTDAKTAAHLLTKRHYKNDVRAEQISVNDFIDIYQEIKS